MGLTITATTARHPIETEQLRYAIEKNERFKLIASSTQIPLLHIIHVCWSYFSISFDSCREFIDYFQSTSTLHLTAGEYLVVRSVSLITQSQIERPFPLSETRFADFNNILRRLFAPLAKRLAFTIPGKAAMQFSSPSDKDCSFVCSEDVNFTVAECSVVSTRLSDLFTLMRHYSLTEVTYAPNQIIEIWGFSSQEYETGLTTGRIFTPDRLPGMGFSLSFAGRAAPVIGGRKPPYSYGLILSGISSNPTRISIQDVSKPIPK